MPYLKAQKRDELVMLVRGYASISDLASALDISYQTARLRLKEPETFTVGEIRKMNTRLHIPIDRIRAAL